MTPRIDSITYTARRGSPPRKPKAGDEKIVKGKLMVRQQCQGQGRLMISNGRPVWEWVEWGSQRDRLRARGRYRCYRGGLPVTPPPAGWKIIESGRPVPKGYLVFIEPYGSTGELGWRKGEDFHGFEATYEGERRAFAIPKTNDEMTRDYFEEGCECIAEKKLRKRPVSDSAAKAVKFYLARCKCSRHPEYQHAPK
jgi:hypothetical protein